MDQGFEAPLFKVLPRNDTGQAPGHQAGVVIPRDLRPFFPTLPGPTPENPVPHVPLKAILVLNDGPARSVLTNYQLQTWGLTRRETRVTGNLQYIRNAARCGDLLLIERGIVDRDEYRFTILQQGTPMFMEAMARKGAERWGVLPGGIPTSTEQQLATASAEITAQSLGPFEPFETDPQLQSVSKRIARSRAFRTAVVAAYGNRCAMCGGGARTPDGITEVEAAHVIARAHKGSDDVRNGIALCRLHHWAFDRHLVGLTEAGQLRVSQAAAGIAENAAISALNGMPLSPPNNPAHEVHSQALAWASNAFDQFWNGGV